MKFRQHPIDFSVTAQSDLCIGVGAAFVLGLKYAGTYNPKAVETIRGIFTKIDEIYKTLGPELSADFLSHGQLRQSIGTVLLSWSLVVAGSGDTELFGHLHRYATEVPKIGEAVKVSFGQELGQFSITTKPFELHRIRKKNIRFC